MDRLSRYCRTIAGNLVRIRKDRGLTQVELAERLGCSQAFISQLERGSTRPSLEHLAQLAEEFDCELGDFFLETALTA